MACNTSKKIDSYIKIAHHVRNKTTTSYIEGKRITKYTTSCQVILPTIFPIRRISKINKSIIIMHRVYIIT